MVRGKGYLHLCHFRKERQQLHLKPARLPRPSNLNLANGARRALILPARVLRNRFRMLWVQRPGAPSAAAMQDRQDVQLTRGSFDDHKHSQCKTSVTSTLPDIDPEYLARVCAEADWDANRVLDLIFGQMENGKSYPRVPKPNRLKRKRVEDEAPPPANPAAKFDNEERRQQPKAASYKRTW
jgi:hypothetical protein